MRLKFKRRNKTLLKKAIIFLPCWTAVAFLLSMEGFVDPVKLATNVLSGSFVFWLGYTLTIVGLDPSREKKT